MKLQLAGYEMAPKATFQQQLMAYTQGLAEGNAVGSPPSPATPVYADDAGNHFMALPGEDNVTALPFIPGSPAQGDLGGFVPLAAMPPSSNGDGTIAMMGGMTKAMPAETALNWLGAAGAGAMLGAAPDSGVASALKTLGVANPATQSALGGALSAAVGAAGLGPVGSLLGGVMSNGGKGLINAMGLHGLSSLLGATGLGSIPGAGAAASMLGGQLNKLADMMTGGAWSGAMDKAAGAVNEMLAGKLPDVGSLGDFAESTGAAGSLGDIDVGAIGAQALDQAAGQLLSPWQVDDDSSAAEQIAHKAVTDNQGAIKEAVTDPSGFEAKIKGIFSGVSSGAVLPAARLTDLDQITPDLVAQGVATIMAEGLPISRMSDPLAPSGSMILQGAATVLSAGLPTARVTSQTAPPDVLLVKGAPTVLVGGPAAAITSPAPPPPVRTSSNAGPAKPDAPATPGSGSAGGGTSGTGSSAQNNGGDSTKDDQPADNAASPSPASDKPGQESTSPEQNAPSADAAPQDADSGLLGGPNAEIRARPDDDTRTQQFIDAARAYSNDPQKQWEYLTALRNKYDDPDIRNDPALVNAQHYIVGRNMQADLEPILGPAAKPVTDVIVLGYEGTKLVGLQQVACWTEDKLRQFDSWLYGRPYVPKHQPSSPSLDAVQWAFKGAQGDNASPKP